MEGKNKEGFAIEPLRELAAVGAIKTNSVRLWVRAEKPGRLKIRVEEKGNPSVFFEDELEIPENNDRDNTESIEIPSEKKLKSFTKYHYKVFYDDAKNERLLGAGSFETAPSSKSEFPQNFAFGLMSCNQPFDESGKPLENGKQMLIATKKALNNHNVKMIFMGGDQMYSDYPESLSLFKKDYFKKLDCGKEDILDCSEDEIKRIYRKRYRYFWNIPEMHEIQKEYPSYMVLDDHDIIDNWGSAEEHQHPKWVKLGRAAIDVYFDYQASRVLEERKRANEDYHFKFSYANCAFFVMDLRTNRKFGENGQLFNDYQKDSFMDFLEEHKNKPAIFILMSVPLVFLPKFIAKLFSSVTASGEDFSDRWSTGEHVRDRDWMLKKLHEHQSKFPKQKVVILSGDIHIGCAHRINWKKDPHEFYQFISSGITNLNTPLVYWGSTTIIKLNKKIETEDEMVAADIHLLENDGEEDENPLGALNFGVVEIDNSDFDDPKIEYFLYSHEGEEPKLKYKSVKI